jgi:putative transposase
LFARRVVGWATGDRLHRDLALAALRKALAVRSPAAGLIHHSDRGSQYCSVDYQAELGKHGVLISMSAQGNWRPPITARLYGKSRALAVP